MAFNEGHSIDTFVQSTASGRIESGLFLDASVTRDGGYEGLDLIPVICTIRKVKPKIQYMLYRLE